MLQCSRLLFFQPVLYWPNLRPVSKKENQDSGINIHAAALIIFLDPGAGGEGDAVV